MKPNEWVAVVIVMIIISVVVSLITANITGNVIKAATSTRGVDVYTKSEVESMLSNLDKKLVTRLNTVNAIACNLDNLCDIDTIKATSLSNKGTAFVCTDNNGKVYASTCPCTPIVYNETFFTPSDTCCVPKTCRDLGKTCNSWADGCGGTVDCGTCKSGQVCNSEGLCVWGS